MNIKRNINFQIEPRRKNNEIVQENAPIMMRVTYNCQRVNFFTGYRTDFSKWDSENQRVKKSSFNKAGQSASFINGELQSQAAAIHEIFTDFEHQGIIPTKDQLKEAFNDLTRAKQPEPAAPQSPEDDGKPTFWDLISVFVKEQTRENGWTPSTAEKFDAMKNHLERFRDRKFRRSDLTFDSFTEQTLYDYVEFLMEKEDMRNSSVEKQIKILKWYLRWALRKKHHTNIAFETFQPKLKKVKQTIVFLTKEELDKIRAYPIPAEKQYLDRARDIYLFCCFTGLRYSDVANLRWGDVKEDCIEITTIKTHDTVSINLNAFSRQILDKYRDAHFENGLVLPVISNQKLNDYIKELAKAAEIDAPVHKVYYKNGQRIEEYRPKYELLGTHTARKTFISNSLMLGVPPEVVMKWTGHSDYSAMKPYIEVSNKVKADYMKNLDALIAPAPEPSPKPAAAKKPAKKKSGK